MAGLHWLDVPHGRVGIDAASGALVAVHLHGPDVSFVDRQSESAGAAGLLRLALPLPHHPAHYVETGAHGHPEIEQRDGALRLRYTQLATREGSVAVQAEIDLTSSGDGLLLRARVHNT